MQAEKLQYHIRFIGILSNKVDYCLLNQHNFTMHIKISSGEMFLLTFLLSYSPCSAKVKTDKWVPVTLNENRFAEKHKIIESDSDLTCAMQTSFKNYCTFCYNNSNQTCWMFGKWWRLNKTETISALDCKVNENCMKPKPVKPVNGNFYAIFSNLKIYKIYIYF